MDKLQPIIKHRFWILFGLTLPIALYAYYSANGSLNAAAEERESSITSTLGGISSGQEPNPSFAEGLKKINEVQEARVKAEIRRLWERQRDRMTWPGEIANEVPDQYRGEFPLPTRLTYKGLYPTVIQEVYEYAQPVPMDEKEASWKPKVIMAPTVIPRKRFGQMTISSEVMWDAQEDTWFLRVLLEAIRDMNADADTVVTSVIRRIDRLELLGGTGESSVVAAATGGGGEGSYGSDYEMMAGADLGGEYGDMEEGGGFGAAQGKVAFDPAEELGSQIDASAPATAGSGGSYGGAEEGMMAGIMGGGGQQNLLRYVAFDETAPFQERGFYMSVIIDETKIPEFLVRLSNSEWPIRLLRFHMGPNPYATAAGRQMVDSGAFGGYGEYGSEMAQEYDEEAVGSSLAGPMALGGEYGGPGLGGGGYGGGGGSRGATPSFKGKNAQLAGALSHPNLVQVDLCGVITMYKPPAEDVLETPAEGGAEAATAQPESTDSGEADPTATDPTASEEAATEETAEPMETEATDETAPPAAADGTTEASDADASSDGDAPTAEEASEAEATPGASEEE